MMRGTKLIDTVVLVGAVNPLDPHHHKASHHLSSLTTDPDVVMPATTLMEFDLLLKVRGYTENERYQTWIDLSVKIPSKRIAGPTATSLAAAADLEKGELDYFDALIVALAQELKAKIITDDKAIAKKIATVW